MKQNCQFYIHIDTDTSLSFLKVHAVHLMSIVDLKYRFDKIYLHIQLLQAVTCNIWQRRLKIVYEIFVH